jgi:hypothetical protein
MWFIGAQHPVEPSGTQHGIFIPKLFPLLVRSRLAASQLYDLALGALEFVNAVLEQVSGTCPKVCTCLQWMLAFQPLQAFLIVVKHDPEVFAIPSVAHSRVIDSLWDDLTGQPLMTQSSRALLAWAINATVWCMHCNNVQATHHITIVANYDLYIRDLIPGIKMTLFKI